MKGARDNEDDKAAAQVLCRIYQDKMQKYQVVYSSTCRLTPNFDVFPDIPSNFRSNWDFDTHPQYWIDIIDGPNEFTEHR